MPLTTAEKFRLAQNLGLALLYNAVDEVAMDVTWPDADSVAQGPWVNLCGGLSVDPAVGHLLDRYLATQSDEGQA